MRLKKEKATAVVLGCLQGVLSLGCAGFLKLVTDMLLGTKNDFSYRVFCVAVCIYYVIYLIIYRCSKGAYATMLRDVRIQIKEKLSKGLIWQSGQQYRKSQTGEVLSKFFRQADILENVYYEPIFTMIRSGSAGMVAFVAACWLEWHITLLGIVVFVVFIFLNRGIQKRLDACQEKVITASEGENNALTEMVQGFYTAKDCHQEQFFAQRYEKQATQSADMNFQYEFLYDLLSIGSVWIEPVLTLVIILAGIGMLTSGSTRLTVGSILGLTQLLGVVFTPISEFGAIVSKIKSAKAVRAGFLEYERAGDEGKKEWTACGNRLPKLEKLSVCDVTGGYGEETVLEHVSLELLRGKKYAIIGESASGKTTLLRLILKQLAPTTGELKWNDVPYKEIGKAELLSHFACVTQFPMIFHKSVEENILAGAERNEKRLDMVLEKSNLNSLHGKQEYKRIYKEPAWELSGGEKKRLAYARALYRAGEILVLDEVTSSVEEELAEKLENKLLEQNECMVLHVTHRLRKENMHKYDAVFRVCGKSVQSL